MLKTHLFHKKQQKKCHKSKCNYKVADFRDTEKT